MKLLSNDEFAKLSTTEMKKYLIKQVENMPDEQVKELYEEIMNDEKVQEYLKNKKD